MRRVVFTQKGGVGKTSIATNLAAISAHRAYRTLLVDLDPQGNASEYLLGQKTSDLSPTVETFFEQTLAINPFGKKDIADLVHATAHPMLSVLPSSPNLDFLVTKLEARQKLYKLRDALVGLGSKFDRIYIDTPPSLGFFARAALVAADRCLVPFDCDEFSRQALYAVMGTVDEIREDHNPELRVEGIVVNQWNAQARHPQALLEALENEGLPILPFRIGSSVKMKESHQAHLPLIHFAPSHKLTEQFVALHDGLDKLERKRK
jgi:chromosome partitioning protein